jgi:hypothetical protein
MRPDQKQGGVLAIFADRIRTTETHWGANSGADKAGAEAMEAVAEYIAANEEYDAARADYDNTAPSHRGKKWGTLCSATSRRTLAHARMKGGAK